MAGVNKVILVGRLGVDPEIRYAPSGAAICNFSIATSEEWKDKNTGEKQQRTEWHRIVIFNRLAEVANEYLRKGSQVYIEGKIQTRTWDDDQGQKRYMTEILCREMQMLGSRSDSQQQRPQGGRGYHGNQQGPPSGQNQSGQRGNYPNQNQGNRPPNQPPPGGYDDDIPF